MTEAVVDVEQVASSESEIGREDVAEDRSVPGSLVEEDLLVEDVSIDGMCGVY